MPARRCTPSGSLAIFGLLALSALPSLALGGCPTRQRSLLPNDLDFLVVGVDPRRSIEDASVDLRRLGLEPRARFDAERFSAASFGDGTGRTAIRVATSRGTALALDAEAEQGMLFSLDPRTGTDLTRDRHADLVIVRTEADRVCFALAEVDRDGVFRAVPTDLRWIDPRLCMTNLLDLDHDGRVEGLVDVPFDGFARVVPLVTVPLTLDDGRFGLGEWPPAFAQAELSRRGALLEDAIERGDDELTACLAIELALIAAIRGGGDAEIDSALARAGNVEASFAADVRLAATRARELRDRAREPEEDAAPE